MSREQLIHEALLLSEKDREMLAEELLVSVDKLPAAEIENLWKVEAQRRLENIRNGSSKPLDGPEVMKKIRASRM